MHKTEMKTLIFNHASLTTARRGSPIVQVSFYTIFSSILIHTFNVFSSFNVLTQTQLIVVIHYLMFGVKI